MGKGILFGLQYLEEGEYAVRGGLGNKVIQELKVENGILYTRNNEDEEWEVAHVPPISEFKLPKELTAYREKKKGFFEKLFG